MIEFLQSNGFWIFIALFFGLVLWRQLRGRGGGCCGGEHGHEAVKKDDPTGHQGGGCH